MDALDLTTSAGQDAFAAALNLAPSVVGLKNAMAEMGLSAEESEERVDTLTITLDWMQYKLDNATVAAENMISTYGDLEQAMALLDPPAKNLVETWQDASSQLAILTQDLSSALGELPTQTAADKLRGTIANLGGVSRALIALDEQIFNLRTSKGDAKSIAILKAEESRLFASISESADPDGVARKLAQISIQRIKAEASLGRIADLQGETNAAQIDSLNEQISLSERLQDLTQSLMGYVDELQFGSLSSLNPTDQLSAAQSNYSGILRAAQGGDVDALGKLQGASSSYLTEAQQYYGGATSQYASVFGGVTGDLREVGSQPITDIELLQRQLDVLNSLNTSQSESSDAIIDTSDKEIAALINIQQALTDRESVLQEQAVVQETVAREQIQLLKDSLALQEAEIRQRAATHEALMLEIAEITAKMELLEQNASLESASV